MTYTVRYAHLKKKPGYVVGDKIKTGNFIALMGSSGQSTAAHLHIDCVEGKHERNWKLRDTEAGNPKSSPRQLNFFIDHGLFKTDIAITTYYADPEYQIERGKVHHGYDVVPEDRNPAHFGIWWNRSKTGEVSGVGEDPAYGNYILISFEA